MIILDFSFAPLLMKLFASIVSRYQIITFKNFNG